MRKLLGAGVGAVLLTGLAACGGGEQAFRNNMRTQALANCRAGSNAEAIGQLAEMGMTVDQLCTCAIDRYLRVVSTEQLKQDRNNELPPALRNATMQCMAEHVQRAGGGTAGPTPGATGAAPVDPTTAPAPAEAPAAPGEAATNAGGDKE